MIQNNDKIIRLASNCFFVKGVNKHLLIDFQNDEWYHVDFYFDSNEEIDITILQEEEIEHLINKQILVSIPRSIKDNFTTFSTNFDVPSMIEYAILDRNDQSNYSICKALEWLDTLLVKYCQIRFYSNTTVFEVEEILETIESSNLESLELLLLFSSELCDFFEEKLELFPKIHSLIFHSSPKNQNELANNEKRRLLMKQPILSSNNCGIVHPSYFSNAKPHILKNMNYNSCLYKKIGIDVHGNVKNCPSMKEVICSVEELEFIDYKRLETDFWNIKKDDIEICKDCEFRYICTDCRVKVEHKYARPNTCIYNPYTNLWKGQEGYEEPELYNQ